MHQNKVILAVVKQVGVQLGSCYKLEGRLCHPSFLPRSFVLHEHRAQHDWLSETLFSTDHKGGRGCHQGLILRECKEGQVKTQGPKWTHQRQETGL